jgi:ketosteroid isomerase-like protein
LKIQVGLKGAKILKNAGLGVLMLTAVFILAGCESGPDSAPPPTAMEIDQARESLLRQDQRFAKVAYEEGIAEAYRRFMAEDSVQLPDGGLAIGGRDAIYKQMLAQTENTDFAISWEVLEVDVAASGELGYTWGIYYFEALDELGAPFIAEGKYVYLWRNNNGRWELILDITNQTEPAYEEELVEEELNEEALIGDDSVDGQDSGGDTPGY